MTSSSTTNTPGKSISEEEKLIKEASLAKKKSETAQADLETAKALKEKESLFNKTSEAQIAEERKKVALAEKEALLAYREAVKGLEITVPSGKITSEGSFIETRILAQRTLVQALRRFIQHFGGSTTLKERKSVNLILIKEETQSIEFYVSFLQGIKELTAATQRTIDLLQKKEATAGSLESLEAVPLDPLTIGYTATGLLKTAADLVSLFRQTTDIKNFEVSVNDVELAAALGTAIRKEEKGWTLAVPSLFPLLGSVGRSDSPLLKELNQLQSTIQLGEGELKKVEEELAGLNGQFEKETEAVKIAFLQQKINYLNRISLDLKSTQRAFQQLQSHLSTVDDNTKVTTQSLLLRYERLFSALRESDTFAVRILAVTKGSNKMTENIWRSARIEHSAGTELSCLVFSLDGRILFADQIVEYTPYKKIDSSIAS